MPCTIFSCFFVIRKKKLSLSIFCQKLPFLPQNAWIFFLKSKNGALEIFLKSSILCTKILGTVKFFLKSKNFLKSNVLKSKIHFTLFQNKTDSLLAILWPFLASFWPYVCSSFTNLRLRQSFWSGLKVMTQSVLHRSNKLNFLCNLIWFSF
jgi:hypothetical protein